MIKSGLSAPQNIRFIIMGVLVMPTIVNIIIAFGLANIMFKANEPVMLWGQASMIIDLAISSLLATLITGLIAFFLTRHACKTGTLSLSQRESLSGLRHSLAKKPLVSTISVAVVTLLINCCVLALFVMSYSENTVPWQTFLSIKIGQASILSLIGATAGTCFAIDHTLCRSKAHDS